MIDQNNFRNAVSKECNYTSVDPKQFVCRSIYIISWYLRSEPAKVEGGGWLKVVGGDWSWWCLVVVVVPMALGEGGEV